MPQKVAAVRHLFPFVAGHDKTAGETPSLRRWIPLADFGTVPNSVSSGGTEGERVGFRNNEGRSALNGVVASC